MEEPKQNKIDDEELQKLFKTPEYEQWSEEALAEFFISHVKEADRDFKRRVKKKFIEEEINGKTLTTISSEKWTDIVDSLSVPTPKVEMVRGERHPVEETLIDIPNKLRDYKSGIWFEALEKLNRKPEYDMNYNVGEIWCHDRNGRPYFAPAGWRRYGFYPKIDETDMETIMNTWHVAYHGTSKEKVDSIVKFGLVLPGTTLADGNKIKNRHGTAGAEGDLVPIYATPSIEYASHYVYTNPKMIGNQYVYCVFQLRVRPNSFRIQSNTLADSIWGERKIIYDLKFGPDELEWLISNPGDVRITGLMVRKDTVAPKAAIEQRFQRNKALCSKRRDSGVGQWHFNSSPTGGSVLSDKGPFKEYREEESKRIEKAYQNWQSLMYLGKVDTDIGINPYFINFEIMEQIRCDDHERRRRVKRVVK